MALYGLLWLCCYFGSLPILDNILGTFTLGHFNPVKTQSSLTLGNFTLRSFSRIVFPENVTLCNCISILGDIILGNTKCNLTLGKFAMDSFNLDNSKVNLTRGS